MAKGKDFKKAKTKSTKHFEIKDDDGVNYDLQKPKFSFYYMKYRQKTCLSQCVKNDKNSVTDTLIQLSQMTWRQIASIPKDGLGYETIPQSEFKFAFPNPPVTPDVNIKVFRYSDGGRIAGYRQKDVYHIIHVGDNLYNH